MGNTNSEQFVGAAARGQLAEAQSIYALGKGSIFFSHHWRNEDPFRLACRNGHLVMAQWIYSLGDVDIHVMNDYPFRRACGNGHYDIALWLYSLGNVEIGAQDQDALRSACANGHLHVAQWINSHSGANAWARYPRAFPLSCKDGHLSIVQWIHSLNVLHAESYKDYSFVVSVANGYVDIARWIISRYKISASILDYCLHCIRTDDLNMLHFLFEKGANLHPQSNISFVLGRDGVSLDKIRVSASSIKIESDALLKEFSSWKNKFGTHQILLQYCCEKDRCHLDWNIVQCILNATKSARTN